MTISITTESNSYLCLIGKESLAEKLGKIVENHKEADDFLSLEIRSWFTDLTYYHNAGILSEREILNQLNTLKEILVNPLTQDFLKEPLLVHGWIWEKEIFEHYCTLSTNCPFTQNQLIGTEKTHLFAKEILEWIKEAQEKTGNRNTQKKRFNFPSLTTEIYLLIAQKALEEKSALKREESSIQELENCINQISAKTAATLKQEEELIQEELNQLVQKISTLGAQLQKAQEENRDHMQKVEQQEEQTTSLSEQIKKLEANLQEQKRLYRLKAKEADKGGCIIL